MTVPLAAEIPYTEPTKAIICEIEGEDNTQFSIKWYLGDREITSAYYLATVQDVVKANSLTMRTGTITLINDSPVLSGEEITCTGVWTDIDKTASSSGIIYPMGRLY